MINRLANSPKLRLQAHSCLEIQAYVQAHTSLDKALAGVLARIWFKMRAECKNKQTAWMQRCKDSNAPCT
jgi:hypothetical protein